MRLDFRFQRYESKLATIVSLFQSGIVGWIFLFPICCIPAIICLACNVGGALVGALCGVGIVLSIIAYILFCKFVKPEKIDERYHKKQAAKYPSSHIPPTPKISQQAEKERLQELALRSYIGSLSDEEFDKLDIRKKNGKYVIHRKTDSEDEQK